MLFSVGRCWKTFSSEFERSAFISPVSFLIVGIKKSELDEFGVEDFCDDDAVCRADVHFHLSLEIRGISEVVQLNFNDTIS